jgi:hypothetical protein
MAPVTIVHSEKALSIGILDDRVVSVLKSWWSVIRLVKIRPTHLLADPPPLHGAAAVAEKLAVFITGVFVQNGLRQVSPHFYKLRI